MKELNKAQVTALFEQEAVLMGTEDHVPECRAVAMFSMEAVEHVKAMNRATPGRYANGYGAGNYTMYALTFRGFQAAASFHNVQLMRQEAQA